MCPPSALTEKIVAVLPRMKCPHRLEPHQIQGLDFISIYPVIQWLVKLAIITREETGDYVRAFSVSQFAKNHMTPEVSHVTSSDVCIYIYIPLSTLQACNKSHTVPSMFLLHGR